MISLFWYAYSVGHHMISSAIWNKYAQVGKLCNLFSLKKFASTYLFLIAQEKSCDYLFIIFMKKLGDSLSEFCRNNMGESLAK